MRIGELLSILSGKDVNLQVCREDEAYGFVPVREVIVHHDETDEFLEDDIEKDRVVLR
jgi:hypothetical protein